MKQLKWQGLPGPQSDIVLSTRVRLARNLEAWSFPWKLDAKAREEVIQTVRRVSESLAAEGRLTGLRYLDLAKLTPPEALSLAERRLASLEFVSQKEPCALLLHETERLSIMLCEEDHLRLQALAPGLQLQEVYHSADQTDTALGCGLRYAFNEKLGYLTQCPTNLGTAMRASVLLHLPALAVLGKVGRLAESIAKLGLTMRGAFGEGSEAEGGLFQLSNQVTLGIAEAQALENLQTITTQIAEQERRAAHELLEQVRFADQVWRAYGVLQHARLLESSEAVKLLSLVRMGAVAQVLPHAPEALTALMTAVQPNTLYLSAQGQSQDPTELNALRAERIRQHLVD